MTSEISSELSPIAAAVWKPWTSLVRRDPPVNLETRTHVDWPSGNLFCSSNNGEKVCLSIVFLTLFGALEDMPLEQRWQEKKLCALGTPGR